MINSFSQFLVEEDVLLLLALVHFYHLGLPFLELLYREYVEYLIVLFDFGASHLFHAVFFNLARHFLDEVLCLDFE